MRLRRFPSPDLARVRPVASEDVVVPRWGLEPCGGVRREKALWGSRCAAAETGAVLVLTVFFACVLLMLCFGVTTLSAAHGARQNLQARADGAALAAIDVVSVTERVMQDDRFGSVVSVPGGAEPSISLNDAQDAAIRFIGAIAPSDRVTDVSSADGKTVAVTVTTNWALPWFGDVLGATLPLTAQGSARILIVGDGLG
ncbi:MAG: pilus assembly protein TadG-related protein [Mycetocola sp.]